MQPPLPLSPSESAAALRRLCDYIDEIVLMRDQDDESNVTVIDVDEADRRVYAVNNIGLTLCLTPEQVALP